MHVLMAAQAHGQAQGQGQGQAVTAALAAPVSPAPPAPFGRRVNVAQLGAAQHATQNGNPAVGQAIDAATPLTLQPLDLSRIEEQAIAELELRSGARRHDAHEPYGSSASPARDRSPLQALSARGSGSGSGSGSDSGSDSGSRSSSGSRSRSSSRSSSNSRSNSRSSSGSRSSRSSRSSRGSRRRLRGSSRSRRSGRSGRSRRSRSPNPRQKSAPLTAPERPAPEKVAQDHEPVLGSDLFGALFGDAAKPVVSARVRPLGSGVRPPGARASGEDALSCSDSRSSRVTQQGPDGRADAAIFAVEGVRCVGCLLGNTRLAEISSFINSNIPHMPTEPDSALWRLAAALYQRRVVEPCRREGIEGIPDWSHADIYRHYRFHENNTAMALTEICRQLRGARDLITARMVQFDPQTNSREADPKTLEMLLKVSALESRQYQLLAQLGGAPAQGASGAGPSGAAPKLLK